MEEALSDENFAVGGTVEIIPGLWMWQIEMQKVETEPNLEEDLDDSEFGNTSSNSGIDDEQG
eukprot:1737112-Ditylum_brightwellii.AAC.1